MIKNEEEMKHLALKTTPPPNIEAFFKKFIRVGPTSHALHMQPPNICIYIYVHTPICIIM